MKKVEPGKKKYQIVIDKKALKELTKIPAKERTLLEKKIDELATNPRPSGNKKLKGSEFYRIRSGDYRVVYAIEDGVLIITVVKVAHRKEVYDNL